MQLDQQYVMGRDIIDMIRDYRDDAKALEYLESICLSIQSLVDSDEVDWELIASICDQRYVSLATVSPEPLDDGVLDRIYRTCETMIERNSLDTRDSLI